jgi:hypothetical protein
MVFRPCAMIPFCCLQRLCYATIRSNRIGAIQDRQSGTRDAAAKTPDFTKPIVS